MKLKEYIKELSLVILGVLIALLIENFRVSVRDRRIAQSYLEIVAEDLNFDITNISKQLKSDTAISQKLGLLSGVLTTNPELPNLKYSLAFWRTQPETHVRKLNVWDSLDYYTLSLYSNTEYKTRKIGFSTIVNSGLSHEINKDLLKKITIYYTTDSDYLDFISSSDDKCHWNAIPWLNQYQGSFKEHILKNDFNATLLRNEASGRYNTTLSEMSVKRNMIEKAGQLLKEIQSY
jgi:hypothetical protein